jgi:hypothetical protein
MAATIGAVQTTPTFPQGRTATSKLRDYAMWERRCGSIAEALGLESVVKTLSKGLPRTQHNRNAVVLRRAAMSNIYGA